MEEYCTCGTRLVEEARFCHRCGRPTAHFVPPVEEVPEPAVVEAAPVVAAPPPAYTLPVNLNNPIAVRVALIVSPLTVLATVLPLVNILFLVWWVAGGWFSVNLYRRIAGGPISVNAGARLGWMIGLLSFVGLSAVLAVTYAFSGKQIFQDMVAQNPQVADVLNDPGALLVAAFLGLIIFFVIISCACAVGGALCARFSTRQSH